MKKLIDIPDDWYAKLKTVIESDNFINTGKFIGNERRTKIVYPPSSEVFRAFNLTPFSKIKVVILGMDPYPTEFNGEPVACGLAFAPRKRDFIPPSLRMIYKRIKTDLYSDELTFPIDMDLQKWAEQGVLLLNAALTVEKGKPGTHLSQWEWFTKEILKTISSQDTGVIFCFWGKDAQKFADCVDAKMHHILISSHPVSAVYKGGDWECNHFLEIDRLCILKYGETIKWMNWESL